MAQGKTRLFGIEHQYEVFHNAVIPRLYNKGWEYCGKRKSMQDWVVERSRILRTKDILETGILFQFITNPAKKALLYLAFSRDRARAFHAAFETAVKNRREEWGDDSCCEETIFIVEDDIEGVYKIDGIDIQCIDSTAINPMEHNMMPKYEFFAQIDSQEAIELCNLLYITSIYNLPRRYENNHDMRFYNFKAGNIIRCRTTPDLYEYYYVISGGSKRAVNHHANRNEKDA